MTKVKAVSVRVMELFTMTGTSLGLFMVDAQWQGMCKLVPIGAAPSEKLGEPRPSMIVDAPSPVDEVFSRAFGECRFDLDVIKASPSLLDKLL